MKNHNSIGLGQINHGELIYYYPLKLETKLDYEALCSHIITSIENSFRFCQERAIGSIVDKVENCQAHQENKSGFDESSISGCLFHDATAVLDTSFNSLKLELHLGCMKAYYNRDLLFETEYNEYKKIYGDTFVSNQKRILLPPLHVQLCNGKKVWLNAILILFTNKMGVLKLELPLDNVPTDHFKDYDYDAYVISIIGGCIALEETTIAHFSEIHSLYLNKILSFNKIIQISCGVPISNIILVDCEGMPEHIEEIPIAVQKDLYEIIAAPIGERKYFSTEADAEEYIMSHSWGKHVMKSFVNTNGGCLTLVDKRITTQRMEAHTTSQRGHRLDEGEINHIYQMLIKSACINTEFALIILSLKRLNADYTFREKSLGYQKIHDIQTEYNKNLLVISTLQSFCMGTVYEQLQAFEQMMPYFVKNDLLQDRMSAIDRIQNSERLMVHERDQFLLAIVGILLTAIFGLPAIRDTLTLLHTVVCISHIDIPYVSINSISVICWLLFLIGMVFWCIKTMRKRY